EGSSIEVRCGERLYRFPAEDTLLLPLVNTSMELFAEMLWRELAPVLAGSRVDHLAVAVEEALGQMCWCEARLGLKTPGAPTSSSPASSN
ncbi:MAG TPA: hypothetical protein VJ885_08220, partial [Thermoanaerobaculia bacterium]|nr:hypothetical protein [Thermoanaerobaculia bacterium]